MVQWFRMHADVVDNEKLRMVPVADRWYFFMICACKCKGLLHETDLAFRRRRVASRIGLEESEMESTIKRLADAKLIDADTLEPIGWEDRQYVEGTSTRRVRAHRQRIKERIESTGEPDETPRNAETFPDSETENRNRNREKSAEKLGQRFDDFWQAYPRKVKKIDCRRAWIAAKLDSRADEIIADVQKRVQTDAQWVDGYIPHPSTYIRGERWHDDIQPIATARNKPDWAKIPRDDDALWSWAKTHGYPNPGSSTYHQYRQTLTRAVEDRLRKQQGQQR